MLRLPRSNSTWILGTAMRPGDIITHAEMCTAEGRMLQQGMSYRSPPGHGVILMSLRENSPYDDSISPEGEIEYEGHDEPRTALVPEPKRVDQPRVSAHGNLTQNGRFAESVERYRQGTTPPARFHVYEKLRKGIWSYRGPYLLVDYDRVRVGPRKVFRFRLRPVDETGTEQWMPLRPEDVSDDRRIPPAVMAEVYKRDRGRCVVCGSEQNLHFDHILPYSLGGTSKDPANIRLLCAWHNLEKGSKLQ